MFEQLRTSSSELRSLVDHLALNCSNPTIVNALLYVLDKSSFSRLPVTIRSWGEHHHEAGSVLAVVGHMQNALPPPLLYIFDGRPDRSHLNTHTRP